MLAVIVDSTSSNFLYYLGTVYSELKIKMNNKILAFSIAGDLMGTFLKHVVPTRKFRLISISMFLM